MIIYFFKKILALSNASISNMECEYDESEFLDQEDEILLVLNEEE